LIVSFAQPISADKEVTVNIIYSAEPIKGLYFRTPEMGLQEGDTHLFTQARPSRRRHWYPLSGFAEHEVSPAEVTCHLPEGMIAVSNGRLVTESKDPATSLVTIHWAQEKHPRELFDGITLVAGLLKRSWRNTATACRFAFYTPPSQIQYASNSFHPTREIMEFFNQENRRSLIPGRSTTNSALMTSSKAHGNTSATTLTDRTLVHRRDGKTSATARVFDLPRNGRTSGSATWSPARTGATFGCTNEGFATYYESLF